jgi:hypothetical protein
MRYCLNKHSAIFISPETHFFQEIVGSQRLLPKPGSYRYAVEVVDRLFRPVKHKDPSLKEFLNLKSSLINKIAMNAYSHKTAFKSILTTFTAYKGKKAWGEKTPTHLYYISYLLKYFPNAKIINLHRKAKPNIASNIISPNINYSFHKACAQYKLCLDFIERHSEHFFNVWYEEFVNDPEKILREVCKYLNVQYESNMLQPGMYSSYYQNPFGKGPVFKKKIGIVAQNNKKYKTVLSDEQESLIDYYINRDLEKRPKGFLQFIFKVFFWTNYLKLKILISYLGLTGIKKFIVRTIRS